MTYDYVYRYVYDCVPNGAETNPASSKDRKSTDPNSVRGSAGTLNSSKSYQGRWHGEWIERAENAGAFADQATAHEGTWDILLDSEGAVTGAESDKTDGKSFALKGSIDGDGNIRLSFSTSFGTNSYEGQFEHIGNRLNGTLTQYCPSGNVCGTIKITLKRVGNDSSTLSVDQSSVPPPKSPHLIRDLLPEQLGELKRVEFDEAKILSLRNSAEEAWIAEYNIGKEWAAEITILRFKDSMAASNEMRNRTNVQALPIVRARGIKNQAGQVVGDIVIYKVAYGFSQLRVSNYLYEITTKDMVTLENIVKCLPIE